MNDFLRTRKSHFELLLIFLMVAGVNIFFLPGLYDWNANSRMALIKAVVDKGQVNIDPYQNDEFITGDKALYKGHYYTDKAIGASVVGIIAYYPIHQIMMMNGTSMPADDFKILITLLATSLPCALLAPLLYWVTKKISGRSVFALVITLAICLGTPTLVYNHMFYGHTLAGLFLFGVFSIWFKSRMDKIINASWTLLSGFGIGLMLITEYPTGLLFICLGCYIIFIMWEQKWLNRWWIYVGLMAGFMIPVGILLLYNYAIFNNPFTLGYSFEASKLFAQNQSVGILGLGLPSLKVLFYTTLHPTMGIFWQSPVLVLGLFGVGMLFANQKYRPEAFLAYTSICVYLVVMSGYYMWWGGLAFTPRQLIPIYPLFGILLAFLPSKFEKPTIILSVISIFQMIIVSASNSDGLDALTIIIQQQSIGRYLRTFEFPPTMIYSVFFKNFLASNFSSNISSNWLGISAPFGIVLLILFEFILLGFFLYIIRQQGKLVVNE